MNNNNNILFDFDTTQDIGNREYHITLTMSEKKMAEELILNCKLEYCNNNFLELFWECFYRSFGLPKRIQQSLFELNVLHSKAYIQISNLPLISGLGPTPLIKGMTQNNATRMARKLMIFILSRLGLIYAYDSKLHFDFIDDIFPIEQDKYAQLGTNKEFLEWHVEDGFHTAKADWVALLCLRGDENSKTYLFEAKDIDLDSDTMHELRQPNFILEVDGTFSSGVQSTKKVSILSEHQDPEIIFDPAFMHCLTDKAQKALNDLKVFVNENKKEFVLEQGDMLIFDNRRTIHARSSYEPRYDGSDRWLLRALILESRFKARDCFLNRSLRVI